MTAAGARVAPRPLAQAQRVAARVVVAHVLDLVGGEGGRGRGAHVALAEQAVAWYPER